MGISVLAANMDKGWATLVAATLAALVSIVSLIVSVISSRSQSKLSSRLTETTNIGKESREYKLKQLTNFYDPLYTLLSANKNIFERIGPLSKARRSGKFNDEETAEVWQKLSNEVVVPNNLRACEITQENLHFLTSDDDESLYLEFITHAHAYNVFKQGAYEAYSLFPFPRDILSSVRRSRTSIRDDLSSVYGLIQKRSK